ncbi:MAG: YbaB/EbfC family nucleoid-associated protein [Sphaerochaetaceae bacterium]|nr:YbaB/EbfC family nucleoid-associated protein [Spirochaetales bacterium]MDY5498729.1 YbaB/EbfC family nucleoid-associated protein [Sphaerochaetaceae bacterium]
MNNPFDFLKNMGQLQNQMQQLQSKMQETTATGEAGAGMVKVTVNGLCNVQSVSIDAQLMTAEDQHTVEVLVASATNEAIKKVQELIKEQGMGMLGGMQS